MFIIGIRWNEHRFMLVLLLYIRFIINFTFLCLNRDKQCKQYILDYFQDVALQITVLDN